jgi:hypothetical protein
VDADLARFYGVPTKRLNEQVRRNRSRFPIDFMFRLTAAEKAEVVANCDHRAFVALRRAIAVDARLAKKLAQLERRLADHDDQILALVRAIRELATPQPATPRRRIGFRPVAGICQQPQTSPARTIGPRIPDSVGVPFSARSYSLEDGTSVLRGSAIGVAFVEGTGAMRSCLLLSCLLAIAGDGLAVSPRGSIVPGPARVPEVRDAIYCQPIVGDWPFINASTGCGTEAVDEIPGDLAGVQIDEVTMYPAEWPGMDWVDPSSLVINFYEGGCPPAQVALASFVFDWSDIQLQTVFDDPALRIKQGTVTLPTLLTLGANVSIGGYVTISWGEDIPWCGFALTEAIYGCPCFVDGAYFGCPRWSPVSCMIGVDLDLAYCLGSSLPTLVRTTSWGRIRALFR